MSYPSLLEIIGHTPLVKLGRLNKNPQVTLLAKLEFYNPSGSIKDRIVYHIVRDAEERGLLKPGGTIVENTSGNTGAAVAMIAAMRSYKAILTMPDKVSQEKINALKAYGAEVVICPTSAHPSSPEHYVNVAKRIAQETPNSFRVDQYDNLKNRETHYLTTGPEIWEQTRGQVDYFVASGSTGGTISGVGRFLKEKNPNIKVVMPDPIGSIYFDYFKTKTVNTNDNCNYLVEGIGEDHLVKGIDFSVIDQVMQFSDEEAFAMGRRLAREEGILAGGSSGANIWGALKVAEGLTKPATIVTVLPDGGVKYLSKMYNDEWMREHHLLGK